MANTKTIEQIENELKEARINGTYKEVTKLQSVLNKLKMKGTFNGLYYEVRENLVMIKNDKDLSNEEKIFKAKELFNEALSKVE